MKKTYTNPKIEIIKINSEDPTAAFAEFNYNSAAIVKADTNSAKNIIVY